MLFHSFFSLKYVTEDKTSITVWFVVKCRCPLFFDNLSSRYFTYHQQLLSGLYINIHVSTK